MNCMSSSKNKKDSNNILLTDDRNNDEFAILEKAADIIWERSKDALKNNTSSRISDEAVTKIMTSAVKLYASKSDGEFRTFKPILGNYDEIVTPTEALTTVTEILRSLRLGPMEFGLWSRKRPEDYHDQKYNPINVKKNKDN